MKRSNGWAILVVAILGCSAERNPNLPTSQDPDGEPVSTLELPARLATIVAAIDPAMRQCPERVWPGIADHYQASQILFVSQLDGAAYLWNDQSQPASADPAMARIELDDLDPQWFAPFNVGVWNGSPTVGISLDFTDQINSAYQMAGMPQWHDFAVNLVVHEGFHFLSGQSDWELPDGDRRQAYPQQWQPRFYRAALTQTLVDVLEGEEGSDLSHAAYWLEVLRLTHAADLYEIRSTDVAEGSAQYATAISNALADLGCEAADADLVAASREHLSELVSLETFDGDRESYNLGVIAGLILRDQQIEGWESRVQDGAAPADVLLVSEVPTTAPPLADLEAATRDAIDASNAEIALEIEPLLERMESNEFYRLPLDPSWLAGSFGTRGFYRLVDEDGQPDVALLVEATLVHPSGVQVVLSEHTVFENHATPCGFDSAWVATIAVDAVTEEAGLFAASEGPVTMSGLPGSVTVDSDDLAWICPP